MKRIWDAFILVLLSILLLAIVLLGVAWKHRWMVITIMLLAFLMIVRE